MRSLTEDALPPALMFTAAAGVALCMPPHNDTWWHLRSGLEMVQQGGVLFTERFSYTAQGAPLYHNHEWLTQLVFYALVTTGGPFLLALACAAFVTTAVACAWRLVRGSADVRFAWLVVLFLGTAMAWAIRPQSISLLLFVAAIWLATSDRDRWLPFLVLVWANLHAVAVTGVIVAGCAAFDALLRERSRARRSIAIFVACVIAPLATPLGWHYWPRVVEVVRLARHLGIHEYRPALEPAMLPFWLMLTAFLVLLARTSSAVLESRRTRVLVLVALTVGVAAMVSVRNIPFFALAAVPAMSRLLPEADARLRTGPLPAAALVVLGSVVAAVATGVTYAWRDGGVRLGWKPISPAAVTAIRRCEGPMFNGLADGGALTWFVPDRKVFIDSRGVEAYPLPLLLLSHEADLKGNYGALFDERGIECAAVASHSVMADALARDPEMQLTHSDPQWQVFRKRP